MDRNNTKPMKMKTAAFRRDVYFGFSYSASNTTNSIIFRLFRRVLFRFHKYFVMKQKTTAAIFEEILDENASGGATAVGAIASAPVPFLGKQPLKRSGRRPRRKSKKKDKRQLWNPWNPER